MFCLTKLLPLALLGSSVFAHGPKLAPDLLGREAGAVADVIVQFKNVPSEQAHDVVRQKGGILKQSLPAIRGAVYSLLVEALDALANDPEVIYISTARV